MTTYVLGAGASLDAGYPLLFEWMKSARHDPDSDAANYPVTANSLEGSFGAVENVEELLTAIQKLIEEYEQGTREQREKRAVVANQYGVFKNAVRAWFSEIQNGVALKSSTYRDFARNLVVPGDCIITFNYDVSLDRELKRAGKFEMGDGYGFLMENLPRESATKVLKLHGSTSWLALLFGETRSGFSIGYPGNTLGSRPVIAKNELSFLGYAEAVDPMFANGGPALPVMIFPARFEKLLFRA